jgi:hypothetical protein
MRSSLTDPLWFLFYILAISGIFSLLGMIVALWAQGFEQLSSFNTFVITPLTYLGGIFYSITMLPPLAQQLTILNPFFYFVDGIRSSMIGVSEANPFFGFAFTVGLLVALAGVVFEMFRSAAGESAPRDIKKPLLIQLWGVFARTLTRGSHFLDFIKVQNSTDAIKRYQILILTGPHSDTGNPNIFSITR